MSRRTRVSGTFFFGALALFAGSLTGLAAYEAFAIGSGTEPITEYTKNAIRKQPMLADLALLAAGVLIGHLWSSAPAVVEPNN